MVGGPAEQGMTFFSSACGGSMISLVGGRKRGAWAEIGKWGTLAAEKVWLAAKPDAIIITGRETELKKKIKTVW